MAKRAPDVETVKKRLSEGFTTAQIAEEFHVSTTTVGNRLREAKSQELINSMVPLSAKVSFKESRHSLAKKEQNGEVVSKFVNYHMELLKMRQGVDKRNVKDLYQRFYNYLVFCRDNGVVPNNMNAYFAIGIRRDEIHAWRVGVYGTPEHREFAQTVADFFASVHEQGATDGVFNPISAMFWQKAHDGMVEASKVEVIQPDPLGDRQSAEDIAARYADVELPD